MNDRGGSGLALRQPAAFRAEIPLSRYVREELLSSDLLIEPALILRTQLALEESLRETQVPYLVRKQGTSGPRSLRGKETDFGLRRPVVFTDNSPAIWLHQRLLEIRSVGDGAKFNLAASFAQRSVPVALAFRSDESARSPEWPLLGRCLRQSAAVWTAGWKLSHILPCSPRNARTPLATLEAQDLAEYFRVRFLRNLSPFNYFLTPRPKLYDMYLDGVRPMSADLGEDPCVIAWVVRILREEIFASHPDVRDAFDRFLRNAGCGEELGNMPEAIVRVISRVPGRVDHADTATILRPVRPSVAAAPDLPDCRVFQINQGVSRETYSGFLCAPDRRAGGWNLLKEMRPSDVILHNVNAKIRAISVVEPMNLDDERLVSRSNSIRRVRRHSAACLEYDGEHLSIDGRHETAFLAALITTVITDLTLPYARRTYGGYAIEVGVKDLTARPDLVDCVRKAWVAGQAILDGEDNEGRDT